MKKTLHPSMSARR